MSFKKVLITGGAGFIGSHLTSNLSNLGWNVTVLDNFSAKNKLLNNTLSNIDLVEGDVRDEQVVLDATSGCSVIIHLAAVVGVDEVIRRNMEMVETETIGTYNVVKAAIHHKVDKIIYASSSAVYDEVAGYASKEGDQLGPVSTYAIAKRLNEKYLESVTAAYGIASNSLRFFNVYGDQQDTRMVVPRFFEQALNGSPIQVFGTGEQTRDFTHISDVVTGISKLAFKKSLSGTFNISSGIETPIVDLAKLVKRLCMSNSKIDLIGFPEDRLSFKVDRRVGCSDKLYDAVGFKPGIVLEIGLQQYLKSLRKSFRKAI